MESPTVPHRDGRTASPNSNKPTLWIPISLRSGVRIAPVYLPYRAATLDSLLEKNVAV
jgi:hypothetical protein